MWILFFKVMLTEFVAEMGDKTQLMLVALTSKYKMRDIIIGTALAILCLNGLAVIAGGVVGTLIPAWVIKAIAAAAFLMFALTSLKPESEEEESVGASGLKLASMAVFWTFFVAELGDKTQLTAIAFGASESAGADLQSRILSGIIVWLGCSIGLFAADMLGLLAGYLLKSKMPEGILNVIAFVIFAVFGVYNIYLACTLSGRLSGTVSVAIAVAGAIFFAVACGITYQRSHRKSEP